MINVVSALDTRIHKDQRLKALTALLALISPRLGPEACPLYHAVGSIGWSLTKTKPLGQGTSCELVLPLQPLLRSSPTKA
jgi:hypothetical protein